VRYYDIAITNRDGAVVTPDPTSGIFQAQGAATTFSSLSAGLNDAGALNVELDIVGYNFANFQGGSRLRVWGLGLPSLAQASNLAYYGISIAAGMRGAPDINQNAKAGTIAQGIIYQSYGNWQGVNQHLDLVLQPKPALLNLRANISFSWKAGDDLSAAIRSALSSAFPGFTLSINLRPIALAHDEAGHFDSLVAFAEDLQTLTSGFGDGSYPGVNVYVFGQTIYVYDTTSPSGSTPEAPLPVAFEDMIGQPTWITPTQLSFTCVLRGDFQIGDWVKFPAGIYPPYVLALPDAAYPGAPPASRSSFQGVFQLAEVHHYGNFRRPEAESWNTTYVANFLASALPTYRDLPDALPANYV